MIRSQQYIKLNSGAKEIQQINPQLEKLKGHIGLGMSMCPCVLVHYEDRESEPPCLVRLVLGLG